MSGRKVGPDQISEAMVLREAGFSLLSISQRVGVSPRTLQRHFARSGTSKGVLRDGLVQEARAALLARVKSSDSILDEVARQIDDDLAHARHLRIVMMEASRHLKADSLKDAVLVMRAAAAYSTAVKNTSDIIRKGLRAERAYDEPLADLPELVVRGMTEEEIAALRDQRALEDEDGAVMAED